MKLFRNIALTCMAVFLASCSEESEIYSTTSYTIVRVDATTTIVPPKVEGSDTPGELTEEDKKLMAAINKAVLDSAPMAVGGSYVLDFTHYDGGPLKVTTASDAEQVVGTFEKIPGKGELTFTYGEQKYTAKIGSYTDQDNKRKVLLTIDFTKAYQELYPNSKIESVVRKEYTSTPSK